MDMNFDKDFQESQRVNELASHLLKTGVVASSFEAEHRAREMIYGKVEASAPKQPQQPQQGQQAPTATQDDYIKMLETSHKLLMKEVIAIKYKLDQTFSEFAAIKASLNKIEIKAASQPMQYMQQQQQPQPMQYMQQPQQYSQQPQQPQPMQYAPQQAPAPQEEKKTLVTKEGYKQEDIAIDKIFYSGPKKD